MYHCFDIPAVLATQKFVHVLVEPQKGRIREKEKHAEECHRHHHNDRCGPHLVPRWPIHQPHLRPSLVKKLAQPRKKPGDPVRRPVNHLAQPGSRTRCPRASRVFSIQFRRLCHFHCRSTRSCHRCSAFAPSPQFLAGEEGFEPPLSVLETDGLPLNLLPFTLSSLLSEGFTPFRLSR